MHRMGVSACTTRGSWFYPMFLFIVGTTSRNGGRRSEPHTNPKGVVTMTRWFCLELKYVHMWDDASIKEDRLDKTGMKNNVPPVPKIVTLCRLHQRLWCCAGLRQSSIQCTPPALESGWVRSCWDVCPPAPPREVDSILYVSLHCRHHLTQRGTSAGTAHQPQRCGHHD
jgi:hypothetical protein